MLDIITAAGVIGCIILMFMSKDLAESMAEVFFPIDDDYRSEHISHTSYSYQTSEEYMETLYLIKDFNWEENE